MPGTTGPELAAASGSRIGLGRRLAGDGLVAKPFDRATLLGTVVTTLDGSPATAPLRFPESPAA